jgi:hypothetical protein
MLQQHGGGGGGGWREMLQQHGGEVVRGAQAVRSGGHRPRRRLQPGCSRTHASQQQTERTHAPQKLTREPHRHQFCRLGRWINSLYISLVDFKCPYFKPSLKALNPP